MEKRDRVVRETEKEKQRERETETEPERDRVGHRSSVYHFN